MALVSELLAFHNWVKHILLVICDNKETVVDEITKWAENGEDTMAFEYTIIREYRKQKEQCREKGREEGREEYLIRLVCIGLRKGRVPNAIAEDLEEDPQLIQDIYKIAEKFAPEYAWESVFEAWKKSKEESYQNAK